MKTFDEFKAEQMKDPEFAAEYQRLQPEMAVIRAMIDGREANHMTQEDLAKKTGIAPAQLRRLENGNANPSIRLLQRLADGLNMNLKLVFEPR